MAAQTQAPVTATAVVPPPPASSIDWAAILAGAVVAAAIGVLFGAFGAALGLSVVSPLEGEGNGTLSLILTGAWMLVTVVAAYWTGGYIAGRMRRRTGDPVTADEVGARDSIHGAVVWALGLLLGAWIAGNAVGTVVTAAGQAAGGAAQAVGAVAQGAGAAVGGAAQAAGDAASTGGLDLSGFDPIAAINNRLLRGTGEAIDPGATVSPAVQDVIFNVVRTGELPDADRAFLAQEVARNSTLTPPEAEARIDEAVAEATRLRDDAAAAVAQAEQTVRETADAARRTAVLTAFVIAAGLMIALAAAMFGATAGGRHRDENRIAGWFRAH